MPAAALDHDAACVPGSSTAWTHIFEKTSSIIAWVSVCTGVLVLAGWGFSIKSLTDVLQGLATMKPNTAGGFLLAGLALRFSQPRTATKDAIAGKILAGVVCLIGLATLSEYLLNIDLGIDNIFFHGRFSVGGFANTGRMSPSTAFALLSLGGALLLLDSHAQDKGSLSECLAIVSVSVGFVALLGYVYGVEALYRASAYSSIALHTAILFVLLGLGTLFVRPDRGIVAVVASNDLGGVVTRRLLPIVIMLPVLVGWLRLEGQRLGWYGTEFGIAIFAIASITVLTVVVSLNGMWLNQADIGRRQNHDRLRQSEERFSKAFHASPVAITISTEKEGRYVDANEAFLKMMGYEWEEVVGNTSLELGVWAAPEKRAEMIDQMAWLGNSGPMEAQFVTKQGPKKHVRVSSEIIVLNGERCVLAVTLDVTEAKLLEEQVRQTQKLDAVGRLAGGVAHDFNNILGVITGYGDLLQVEVGADSKAEKYVQEIRKSALRAAELTRQLLAFSRQEVANPRILDLNAVVNNLSKMLKRMIKEDIALVFTPEAGLGTVRADQGQVEQVLMNLVVNARDAISKRGRILIETANVDLDDSYATTHEPAIRSGPYVMLSVSDTGCGMDRETQLRAFEPFFTTKAPGRGTGLGLSTVYGIVKQSNGYVWVYSEPGKGATFKVYLPRISEVAQPLIKPEVEQAVPRGCETVLLVEDDDGLRLLAANLLRGHGYRVLEAKDGENAATISRNYGDTIALLLTDVIMPGMNGTELASRLRHHRPQVKVLYMSGYPGRMVAESGVLQSETLLSKPFTRKSLLAAVRAALRSDAEGDNPNE